MMGYISGRKNNPERTWFPDVQSFFGEESPVLKVMPPVEFPPVERPPVSPLDVRILPGREQNSEASKNTSFYSHSCSIQSSCLDSPSSQDDGTTAESSRSTSQDLLESTCIQFGASKDLDKQLKNEVREDLDLEEWKQVTDKTFNCEWNSRTKHGTFEKLRRTWETQRDLLLENLKEKDDIIERQREMLHNNTKQLIEMEASIDALETRFSREIASFRLKIEQHEQRCLKKAESMLDTRDEIERGQSKLKKDLKRFAQTAHKDIYDLDNALHERANLYMQSEQEKQAVTQRLDAANEELGILRDEVKSLTQELESTKSLQTQRSGKHEVPASRKKTSMSPFDDGGQTKSKKGDGSDNVKRENVQLKREVFEMRERLIDLKEHSEELESQISQQDEALSEAFSLKQELDLLKTENQDQELLLSVNRKTINGLKQSLNRLQSEMYKAKEPLEEARTIEEILGAQQRCEEMENHLIQTQSERDICLRKAHKLEGLVRSTRKQSKEKSKALERMRKEQTNLKKTLNCKNSEIATLQTNLRVETLMRTSSGNSKTTTDGDLDEDLIKELMKSKVSLAEMSELVIQLRQKVESLKNKLRSSRRTKYI